LPQRISQVRSADGRHRRRRSLLAIFTTYIDSGFGLLGGEVAFLATTLAATDIALAAIFWSWGADEDIIARLAWLIGNWNNLARIVFESFAGLGLKASGTGMSTADLRARYACLSPWSREPAAYGQTSLTEGYALCEIPVTRILVDLLKKELQYARQDSAQFFDAAQNARLVADAESYYRAMYLGSNLSWNQRDQHMFDTLQNILAQPGSDRKAVVWAHNSHIGDARFTDMGRERGELNIGQLCRQAYGRDACLIGFGTHTGTVAAATDWDGPMEVKTVRPSLPGSYEALCHQLGDERLLLDLRAGQHDALRSVMAEPRLERYIGVIYRPETERWSHYGFATLPDQYDAFAWFNETHAVTPLPTSVTPGEDETYPFGL
jgi:hypothetical protein